MVRELVGQAALADPRLAGDEHEPPATGDRVVERAEQRAELALAADEPAGGGGRRRCGRVELGVLTQDRLLELAQLATGLDPELVHERAARVLVGAERLGLAPRAVQRAHVLAAQALAQRVLGDQRLELGHDVAAPERQVGLDAIRDRLQAQLLEPLGRRLCERDEREVGQGRPAPQRQGGAERLRRPGGRARGKRRVALVDVALEAVEVARVGLDLQHVAGRAGDEHAGHEHLAQGGHVDLDELGRGGRRPLAPQLVHDPVARDDLVRAQQQQRQQRALLGRAEQDGHTVDRRLERPQQPKLHHLASSLTELSLDAQKIGAIGRGFLGQLRVLLGQLHRALDRPRHLLLAALGGGVGPERTQPGQRRAVLG